MDPKRRTENSNYHGFFTIFLTAKSFLQFQQGLYKTNSYDEKINNH